MKADYCLFLGRYLVFAILIFAHCLTAGNLACRLHTIGSWSFVLSLGVFHFQLLSMAGLYSAGLVWRRWIQSRSRSLAVIVVVAGTSWRVHSSVFRRWSVEIFPATGTVLTIVAVLAGLIDFALLSVLSVFEVPIWRPNKRRNILHLLHCGGVRLRFRQTLQNVIDSIKVVSSKYNSPYLTAATRSLTKIARKLDVPSFVEGGVTRRRVDLGEDGCLILIKRQPHDCHLLLFLCVVRWSLSLTVSCSMSLLD